MQKKFLMTAITIVLLCLGGMASAGTASWTGDYSTDFMTQYNWAPENIPGTSDILNIGPGSYYQPVFNAGAGVTNTAVYAGVDSGGYLTVSSGTLRLTGNSDSESLFLRNGSLATDGALINGGTVRCGKGLYLGKGTSDLGRLTITSGTIAVSGVTTVGYEVNSSTVMGGLLNIWGGSVNMGTLVRMDPIIGLSGAGKECSGRIDIRTPGVAVLQVTTTLTFAGVQQLIGNGRIVSAPGYAPTAVLMADANFVQITAQQVYYATNPSPAAIGGHHTFSAAQTLSWVKPLPRIPGDTVTSDVYFGLTNPPTTLVAGNTTASSITVTTLPENTYYWKVDSRDPDGGSPIVTPTPYTGPGDTWTFDTRIAPTVTVGTANSRQAAYQRANPLDPNSDATLAATATDDGYPNPLTYQWTVATMSDPNTSVTFVPSPNVLNPSVVLSKAVVPGTSTLTISGATSATNWTDGNYHLQLTAYDGANTQGYAVLTVKVFPHPTATNTVYCDAQSFVGFTAMTGDMNNDCKVDYKDLAILASQWLSCNSLSCP